MEQKITSIISSTPARIFTQLALARYGYSDIGGIVDIFQSNFNNWIKKLAKEYQKLNNDEKIDANYIESEENIYLTLNIYDKVIREYSEKKRVLYRDLLLSFQLKINSSSEEKFKFLNILNQISPVEVIILKNCMIIKNPNDNFINITKLESQCKKDQISSSEMFLDINHLHSLGLMVKQSGRVTYGGGGTELFSITDFGKEFIQFIKWKDNYKK
jgi:hypothetical protein